MKKLFVFMAFLPLAAACIAEYSDVSPVTAQKLESYSKKVMSETVAMPVEAVEFALDFDAYLQLSDIEKEADYRFFGNCTDLGQGMYHVAYHSTREFRSIYMKVDTKGLSIREEGVTWKLLLFEMAGNDFDYSYLDFDFALPADSEITMLSAADSTWAVNMGEKAVARMKMHPKRGELYEWTVESHGKEDTTIGMMAEYGTVGNFTIRERYLESMEKTNVYDGIFNLDIYREGVPHDYCHMSFSPGIRPEVKTSR